MVLWVSLAALMEALGTCSAMGAIVILSESRRELVTEPVVEEVEDQ